MTQDKIMKLVDGYVEASAKCEHIIEHYAQTEFQIAQAKDDLAKVRAAVVAAIDALESEVEMWKATANAVVDFEKVELRKQVAALTKDAVRYQWLRHGDNDKIILHVAYLPRNENLDVVIDTAMKESK